MTEFERILAQALRTQRGNFVLASVAGASAGAAGVALLALSGWFITAAAAAGLTGAAFAFNFLLPSAGVRALAIARTLGRYGERLFAHAGALALMARLRPALFTLIAAGRSAETLKISSAEASTALNEDLSAIERASIDLVGLAGAVTSVLAGLAIAALGGLASAACLAVSLVIGAFVAWVAPRLVEDGERAVLAARAELKAETSRWIEAGPECVCYGAEDLAYNALAAKAAALSAQEARATRQHALFSLWPMLLSGFAAAAIFSVAAGHGAPRAAAAALGAVVALEALAAFARLFERTRLLAAARARLRGLCPSPQLANPSLNRLVIAGRPLTLARGRRILITGPSGAGKTTALARLIGLVGAAAPAPHLFAFAPQDGRALTGTIRDNLQLGSSVGDEAALWAALSVAQLDIRVRALPEGLDTWVGDGGARLSGGERRRLGVARAIAHNAQWLVFDEPSEGLDRSTENALIDALGAHLSRTEQGLILVTHRGAWRALPWDEIVDLDFADPAAYAA